MTENSRQEQSKWITTVIMSTGLQLLLYIFSILATSYSELHCSRLVLLTHCFCTALMLLSNHEISAILQRQQHRVRYSESVEIGSVIFSLSAGVAFILADIQDLLVRGEEEFLERVQKFISIHRNSFLVLSAALHGPQEWNVMFRIQRRFLGSNLRIIPVHNTAETVKLMLTIAKMNSKPRADDVSHKMAMTKTHIIENSPVWKMLQEYQQLHSN